MATYVLIHGAACGPWHWHLLEPELRALGHDVVTVDLPCDDDRAGLAEYADAVVDAVETVDAVHAVGHATSAPGQLVLVAHSFAGLVAPLTCDRLPVDLLVMLNAMPPRPGEPPADWWAATGHAEARRERAALDGTTPEEDPNALLRGLPDALAAEVDTRWRPQSGTPMEQPWPLLAWPAVPTRFLLCRDDAFFPAAFLRKAVEERLPLSSSEIGEMDGGGHFPMLVRPRELAGRLEAYRRELPAAPPPSPPLSSPPSSPASPS
ncbi:alpha/beta fold hydrolase [Streptomyces sp. NPDC059009]|uniref:alpha/beta fold hydrolase n=1 Tax=Streptomyces sp. NPDC059009 TaxID=3346694 RepID=UPI00368D48D8